MNHILRGGLAGSAATIPMTAFMAAAHYRLPPNHQYAQPPREIVMNFAAIAGFRDKLTESQKLALTMVSHFGYGSAMGAIFGMLPVSRSGNSIAAGVGFGMVVWLGSYLGILPATRLLSPATRHPIRRTAVVFGAHLIWGAALGAVYAAGSTGSRSHHRLRDWDVSIFVH